jgi:hypothetical protein
VTFAAKWLLCARVLRFALVAQLDRASDFESEGREFESLRARHENQLLMLYLVSVASQKMTLGSTWEAAQKKNIRRHGAGPEDQRRSPARATRREGSLRVFLTKIAE